MSCPVCFNASVADDTVRQSINLGILVLLGVTGIVLAGFLRFIISIVRRAHSVPAEARPAEARPAEAGHYSESVVSAFRRTVS